MPKSYKDKVRIYEQGKRLRSKYGVEGDTWCVKLMEWLREQELSEGTDPRTAESIFSRAKTAVEGERARQKAERLEKKEEAAPKRSVVPSGRGSRTTRRSDHDKVRIYQKGNDLRSQHGTGGSKWYEELWKWLRDEGLTEASKPESSRGTYRRCKRAVQKRDNRDDEHQDGEKERGKVQELQQRIDDLSERLKPYEGIAGGLAHIIARARLFAPLEHRLEGIEKKLDRLIKIWEPKEREEDADTHGND